MKINLKYKQNAFRVRSAENGKQKTEFVKICFFANFRDSTRSPGGGFFGRLTPPSE